MRDEKDGKGLRFSWTAAKRQTLVMCGIAVLLGLGARAVQKKPVPFWGYPKPIALIQPKAAIAGANSVSVDSAFVPAEKPYDIDFATVMGLFMKRKKENIPFIDAREHQLYEAGHITGAINIPFERLADCISTLEQIHKDQLVTLYCDGGDCHLSHDLAEFMIGEGWKRLAVYTGGWEEWSKETDFVVTGSKPE
jgi:rhodanese-related sulfurtransferase